MKYYIHHSDGQYGITDASFYPDMAIEVPDHLIRVIDRHNDEARVIQDALRELDNEAHKRFDERKERQD